EGLRRLFARSAASDFRTYLVIFLDIVTLFWYVDATMDSLAGRRLPCRPFLLEGAMAERVRILPNKRRVVQVQQTRRKLFEALTKRLRAFGVDAGRKRKGK
ncbi:hypothetical protein SCH01S_50_00370, partial [Sphingomonas changbaiensis NBRC 104936]